MIIPESLLYELNSAITRLQNLKFKELRFSGRRKISKTVFNPNERGLPNIKIRSFVRGPIKIHLLVHEVFPAPEQRYLSYELIWGTKDGQYKFRDGLKELHHDLDKLDSFYNMIYMG